ncbi:MAG TPA: TolC family protein, partial [Myxococcota bacterium]|nr:TolC family protein [Myxococcota bacterium]
LERRPEIRAQQADVRARDADVALARREFLPDFTLRAGYDTSWQEVPLRPMVGLELNIPLQLERRRAALEEADARLAREKSRLRSLENRVRLEVGIALQRLHEARHLLELSDSRLLPVARSRASAARAGFASGRVGFLELVEAERALASAEQSEFDARAELSRRLAELARAVGDIAGTPEGAG